MAALLIGIILVLAGIAVGIAKVAGAMGPTGGSPVDLAVPGAVILIGLLLAFGVL